MTIRIDKKYLYNLEGRLNNKIIIECIKQHKKTLERLTKNKEYYEGGHDILKRSKRNAKPVNNFCKNIADNNASYFMGNPITFTSKTGKDITKFTSLLDQMNIHVHDSDLAKELSIYGTGYEIIYIDDEKRLKIKNLSPFNTFVVYDDTVEKNSLMAITYYPKFDINFTIDCYHINVYTDEKIVTFKTKHFSELEFLEEEVHQFDRVPITQFFNNGEGMSDFESVITLIDSYNNLMSDRLEDKEKFADSILHISGERLETDDETDESMLSRIKRSRILETSEGTQVEYVTKTMNEGEVGKLAKEVVDNIHKFSNTPDFTDENFAGNASGVAMQYKLLPLENAAKIKERFFISGLRRRLKILNGALKRVSPKNVFDIDDLKITISRVLPVNNLETAQMTNYLDGIVSKQTLSSLFPFVEDPTKEREKIREEKAEDTAREREDFGLVFKDTEN